jgi:hypothetical protein
MRKAVSQAMAPFSRGLGAGRGGGAGLERTGILRAGGMRVRGWPTIGVGEYYNFRQVGQLCPSPSLDQGRAARIAKREGRGHCRAEHAGIQKPAR